MPQINIRDQIAIAIKEADKHYFYEDYLKQADHVLEILSSSGYKILPQEATAQMIEAGKIAISYGAMKPTDLVKTIYKSMIDHAV